MRSLILSVLTFLLLQPVAFSQVEMSTYLPEGYTYDQNVQTPKEILGYYPGEWHLTHDQMLYYMRTITAQSERVTIDQYGYTYEHRPLVLLTITSPENLARIDEIKEKHRKLSDPDQSANVNTSDLPIIVWIGPSVHGNEASGTNSALLTIYFWAAAQGGNVDEILKNTVILVEASINPDGMTRFSTWVNMHKSLTAPNPDVDDREHNEVWPGGRTNHYWFDLNRDYLPVQHPEMQARIEKFHEWKPNVYTDHHEMGSNTTFFFMPGIKERQNPLIPETVWDLTTRIGDYHAHVLDSVGELYYSKESYDEFYYGYGSTYPDFNGAIGILFEQASIRGHARDTDNGYRDFSDAIRNQFNAALSTIWGSHELRDDLMNHQKNFYTNAIGAADNDPVKAYVFGAARDQAKSAELIRILVNHEIKVFRLNGSYQSSGKTYSADDSFIVPMRQAQYRTAKGMFETISSFGDSLFYDVSSWTFPLSMNIPYAEVSERGYRSSMLGEQITKFELQGTVIGEETKYAYAFEPFEYYSHRAVYQILDADLRAKVASQPFTYDGKEFARGSIVVTVKDQELNSREIFELMQKIAEENYLQVYSMNSGYTGGKNLGSREFLSLKKPKTAILVGDGVRGYEAGELWHLLDYRMKMPVTLLDVSDFDDADLSKYTHIVMVQGNYDTLMVDQLKPWLQEGGILVATKNANKWLSDRKMIKNQFKESDKDTLELRPYEDMRKYEGAKLTSGTIFQGNADLTHPLLFGYESNTIPLFRNHNLFMLRTNNSYGNPVMYSKDPLLSGYVYRDNLEKLKETAAVSVNVSGDGFIISILDNPNFRAIWYGTNKIFLNSLFFGSTITPNSAR